MATVSIIVRTKDEERWITHCLQGIFSQTYADFEVILVDNESTDKTVEKAKQFPLAHVVTCADYRPGKALNAGIRASQGMYVVCLSGHCIPVNEHWLANLLRNFEDSSVAGVYGRQEPMAFTPDTDKRDLLLLFGLDRKIQRKDGFFHNANSMIRRDRWEAQPFDETLTNIEDRAWAQQMLQRGDTIVYEPEASVYHHHGVHHDGNPERCTKVMRVMERLHTDYTYKSLDLDQLNIVALIPVREDARELCGKPLVAYTIERALETACIKRTIVCTDSPAMAARAEALGAEAPFLRDPAYSKPDVDVLHVLRYCLEQIERLKILPDVVVSLEVTFPFRAEGLLDDMIMRLVREGLDSVVAVRRENRAIWKERDNKIIQLDEGLIPRHVKDPTFLELRGLACVTHPQFIRQGTLLGPKLGMYEVTTPYAHLEVRNAEDLQMASWLMPGWVKSSTTKLEVVQQS